MAWLGFPQGPCRPIGFMAPGLSSLLVALFLEKECFSVSLRALGLRACRHLGQKGGWICEGKPRVLFVRPGSGSDLAQLVIMSKSVCPTLSSSNIREGLRCSEHEGFEEEGEVLVLKVCTIRTQRALDLEFREWF